MKWNSEVYVNRLNETVLRYPMVLIVALIATISAVFAMEFSNSGEYAEEIWFLPCKIWIVSTLGISLLFGLNIISQRIGKTFLLDLIGILILIGVYFLLPKEEKDFTEVYAFLLIPLFILSHLLVAFGAYFNNKSENSFWEYNKSLFINIILAAIFAGVLTGGIMLAILAIDNLFELKIDEMIYPKTLAIFGIFGSCLIFLLFNAKGLKILEKDEPYPLILKFFVQFILIPLLLIYVVILYMYGLKILINWELPRGWVSYLVLAYSVIGILAILLVYPLKQIEAKSWVKMFSNVFYFTLIPLLVLLFVAIFTRVLEYGFTEPRYYLLMIAIWLTVIALYFIFFKNASIKCIPISLFIFGLIGLALPYFNAFSVAERSQKNEFVKLLEDNNLLENNKINFKRNVGSHVVREIESKVEFLLVRNEEKVLLNVLNDSIRDDFKNLIDISHHYQVSNEIRNRFKNVHYDEAERPMERRLIYFSQKDNPINVEEYDWVIDFYSENSVFKINDDEFEIFSDGSQGLLNISINQEKKIEFKQRIEEFINQNHKNFPTEEIPVEIEEDLGKYEIKLILKGLNTNAENLEDFYFNRSHILIREKD